MPCACKVPLEKYPETAEWGPLFWKVLHGLAELCGRQTDVNLQGDEVRTWFQLISNIYLTLPCDICHDHYKIWLTDHSPIVLATMPYNETRQWIRTYFWSLHNEINEGNNKPIFSFDELSETYKNTNITASWRALEPVIRVAIQHNGISLLPWKKWLNFVRTLQGIYGVS